jgi:hypothetical protein
MIEKTPDNQHLWNQFIRLGDMMGDGLHHEPDGKWISKEYRKLAIILMPDYRKEERAAMRKVKAASIDVQMAKLIEQKKCNCGGTLQQKKIRNKGGILPTMQCPIRS